MYIFLFIYFHFDNYMDFLQIIFSINIYIYSFLLNYNFFKNVCKELENVTISNGLIY